MNRVLFLLKQRQGYGPCHENYNYCSSGLFNSATFVVDMLNASGIEAKLVEVADNNSIDREVSRYRPNVVIVEAFWVVPEKFDVLKRLHPDVQWIVRGHSDFPFLATEGIALEWVFGYLARGVFVAFNSEKVIRDLRAIVDEDKEPLLLYLPNFYPVGKKRKHHEEDGEFKVGCFGAIRPLKNQLIQAIAAIRFADATGKYLKFYVNATRCEQGGDSVLRNLRALFANTDHTLVETKWFDRHEFLHIVSKMDVALCISLSETFCIVAADAVSTGVPLVCSSEIPWACADSIAPANDSDAIVRKLYSIASPVHFSVLRNRFKLRAYSKKSKEIWLKLFLGA